MNLGVILIAAFVALHILWVCLMGRRERLWLSLNWVLGITVGIVAIIMMSKNPSVGVTLGVLGFGSFGISVFLHSVVDWNESKSKMAKPGF